MKSCGDKLQERLIIHATNVHQGGGQVLLDAILRLQIAPGATAFLDARMPLPAGMPSSTEILRVKPSIVGRLQAERLLAASVEPDDTVLCFGNLPPLLNVAGRVVVFVQNRYLIDSVSLAHFPLKDRIRLRLERLWFRMRAAIVDEFIVQTPSMKDALAHHLLKIKTKPGFCIKTQPFMAGGAQCSQNQVGADTRKTPIHHEFVYVASGESHKNHRRLIEAWILLAREGCYPSLALTLDEIKFANLCAWIESQKQRYLLHLENTGVLPPSLVPALYKRSGALIFPSTLESFGLPLIEARDAGLAVLAGELDYVRDVLNPEETFNPDSAVSIARAVKRFKRIEEPKLRIIDACAFVTSLMRRRDQSCLPAQIIIE
jgi:glycosyltransferase involved in cell wall biosynthesis